MASESPSDISNMSGEEGRDTTYILGVEEEALETVSLGKEYDGSALRSFLHLVRLSHLLQTIQLV